MSGEHTATMKAVRYHGYGGSDVLVYEDADRPAAGASQVVVRVAGTSFNDADAGLRSGLRQDMVPVTFPHIPQMDMSGVVTEVGEGVTEWSVGDAVIGLLPTTEPGAAAEYVAAPVEVLAAAPRGVDLADASALPLAGLTAWQALFDHARIDPGQRILIYGASGAVGGYAVQLAAQIGATVTGTASERSRDRVLSYGADQVVDHSSAPIEDAVDGQQFDVILNLAPISQGETVPLVGLVADGGTLVSMATPCLQDGGPQVRVVNTFARSDAAQLAELVARVDAGRLHIWVAERLPLTELAKVHARAADRIVELGALIARVEGGDVQSRWHEVAPRLRVDARNGYEALAGKTVLVP